MATPRQTRMDGTAPREQMTDELVAKVGAAAGKVAGISQALSDRIEAGDNITDTQVLAAKAEEAALRAIDEEGISVNDYTRVLKAAESDAELEQRLAAAARGAVQ
ncbi:MAG TPA: DUF4168 domain-containing protein [Acetobacteraceae bacterium]